MNLCSHKRPRVFGIEIIKMNGAKVMLIGIERIITLSFMRMKEKNHPKKKCVKGKRNSLTMFLHFSWFVFFLSIALALNWSNLAWRQWIVRLFHCTFTLFIYLTRKSLVIQYPRHFRKRRRTSRSGCRYDWYVKNAQENHVTCNESLMPMPFLPPCISSLEEK